MRHYKCRKTEWFDFESQIVKYGIKVFNDGKWIDAGDDNGVLLFADESERDAKIKELEK